MSQRFAQLFCEYLDDVPLWNDRMFTGPFGLMVNMCEYGVYPWDDSLFLVPTKAVETDGQCLSEDLRMGTYAAGEKIYSPGCKQFLFVKDGEAQNTNVFKYDPNKPIFEQMRSMPKMNIGATGYNASRDFVLLEWDE